MPNSDQEGTTAAEYDVVIVGGAAAGLSAGLALSRARRKVAIVDSGEPRNAAAGHVHNYLGREGATPGELYAAGREEVRGYGGTIVPGRAENVERAEDGSFRVFLQDGGVLASDLDTAVHQALMWRQWCEDVVLFLDNAGEPGGEQVRQLAARGIADAAARPGR